MQSFTKVASRQQIIDGYSKLFLQKKVRVLCLYNSALDMIISESDADLMMLPIDDKIVNRAHGAAETTNIRNYRFYDLNQHLQRLENTADLIGITLPLSREVFSTKLHELAFYAYKSLQSENYPNLQQQILVLRILVSAGHGDFGLFSNVLNVNQAKSLNTIIYAAIYIPNLPLETLYQGVQEYIHKDLWTKKDYLAQAKTVNYLSNCIMADYSKLRGGYQGIRLDEQGNLTEGAVANIAYVLKDGTFAYPPLEKTIIGTTLNAALNIVSTEMIPKSLVLQTKELDIHYDSTWEQINELFFLQGEKVIPILKLDGKPIGDGTIGPVTTYLQTAIKQDQIQTGELIEGFQGI